jgi:pyridoxine 5-phosphate synthase
LSITQDQYQEAKVADLSVNVDHVATIRQARGIDIPDPVHAAVLAELAGAKGIIIHLREDRRHIQDRDLRVIKETVKTRLNLEMAATEELKNICISSQPYMCTLVPEKREELTTEGGLEVKGAMDKLKPFVDAVMDSGVKVSLFIDADKEQIKAASELGVEYIEIHTGHYADAVTAEEADHLFNGIKEMAAYGRELGLIVHAGHGLNYRNIHRFVEVPEIAEYSIGHAIIARAVLVGMDSAVREMAELVRRF